MIFHNEYVLILLHFAFYNDVIDCFVFLQLK